MPCLGRRVLTPRAPPQCHQLKEVLERSPFCHRVFLMIFALMRKLSSRPNRDEAPFHALFQTTLEGLEVPLPQQQGHQIIFQTPDGEMGIQARAIGCLGQTLLALLGDFLGEFRRQFPLDQPTDVIREDCSMDILLHR